MNKRLVTKLAFFAALVMGLSVSSCAAVPTSGPVQVGQLVQVSGSDTFVRVIARPPAPGLTQVEVVRGFLFSQASRDNNFSIARQYLTPEAAASWNPANGVEVFEGAGSFDLISPDSVSFFAPTALTLDQSGRPEVPSAVSFTVMDFRLQRIDGQWRVANPPSGLLISRGDLARNYRGYALWFPDPTGEVLVADNTVVPLASGGIATSLVQNLLQGPSKWLAPAVRSAFPANTSLSLDAVTVIDGVARVPLNAAVLSANTRERQLLAAQLGKTLSALPGITAVEIVVGAQLLQLGDWGDQADANEWGSLLAALPSGEVTAVQNERPVLVTAEGVVAPAEPLGFGGAKLIAVAANASSSTFAAITSDRQQLLVSNPSRDRLLRFRFDEQLATVRFDRFGWVWLVGSKGVWALNAEAPAPEPKLVGGLPAQVRVNAVIPATDGVRVLLRAEDETSSFVALAAIKRGEDIDLVGLHRVDRDLGVAVSIGWLDANRIAVLQETATSREVVTFDLASGQVGSLGAPAAPTNMAVTNANPVLVSTDVGEIYRQEAGGWLLIGSAANPIYAS